MIDLLCSQEGSECGAFPGELGGEPELEKEWSADGWKTCLPGKGSSKGSPGEMELACLEVGCNHTFLELRGGVCGRDLEMRGIESPVVRLRESLCWYSRTLALGSHTTKCGTACFP